MPWWTIFTHELVVEDVDMSDWEMLVEQFPERPQLPQDCPGVERAEGTEAVRDDGAIGHRAQRAVHLRRSHHAVEHGRAQSEREGLQRARHLPRHRAVFERRGRDPDVRPFRADMQTAFKIDGGKVHPRAHQSDERRGDQRGHRLRRPRALAGDALQREVADRLSDPEGNLFQGHELHRQPATATSPARSTSSRAAAN